MKMSLKMSMSDDTRVERLTISLPADLFAWGEQERASRHISRSQFVADLYRRYRDEIERERRIARYSAAYSAMPATEEENALTEASMDLLFNDPEE